MAFAVSGDAIALRNASVRAATLPAGKTHPSTPSVIKSGWQPTSSETITALIFFQSLVYFFKSFVLATVIALPTKILADDQIGTGVGMVNFGGQGAGFVAPAVMGFLVTGTGSFDAAFDFLLVMTALSVLVAATIRTRERQLIQSLA